MPIEAKHISTLTKLIKFTRRQRRGKALAAAREGECSRSLTFTNKVHQTTDKLANGTNGVLENVLESY